MKITFLTLTISRFDLLDRLMGSVDKQTKLADEIIIVDNSNGKLLNHYNANRVIIANNLGLSLSLNLGIKLADPDGLLIISNDDNVLYPEAFETFEKLSIAHQSHPFFASKTNNFSVYALRPKLATETIGYFDEMFYPYGYEDNDYYRRMKLKNLNFITTKDPLAEIGLDGQPSQTTGSIQTPQHIRETIHQCHTSNKLKYIAKWGGLPEQEIFDTPFNQKINTYEHTNYNEL